MSMWLMATVLDGGDKDCELHGDRKIHLRTHSTSFSDLHIQGMQILF